MTNDELFAIIYNSPYLSVSVTRRLPNDEALRSDEIVRKCGGRFKLTALIQHRLRELIINGARPLVEREGRTDIESSHC